MRNSLIPLAAILAVALAAAWMLRGAPAIGAAGPDVQAGIFRFAAKERQRTAPTALPGVQVEVEGAAGAGAAGAAVVLVAGEDRQVGTQVLLLALAEEITARGGIALLDPAPVRLGEPLPLGVHLRLGVAGAAWTAPAGPGAAVTAAWRVAVSSTAPSGPAARWLPDDADRGPAAELVLRLAAPPLTGAAWPAWYAGLGHAAARALLARLGLPERIADPGTRARADAWPAWEGRSEAAARLPLPPGTDDLRWQGAFQFPLVRGWVGAIPVAASSDRTGNPQSALAPLLKRLQRGGWQGQVAADGRSVAVGSSAGDAVQAGGVAVDIGAVAWTRDHDGVTSELRVAPAGSGWRLELWQVLPGASGVVHGWRQRAAAGDAAAAALLARHRGTVALPADLRAP